MKKLIILLFLIPFYGFSQIPGKKIEGPIKTKYGFLIQEGDTIIIGTGTNPNGDFKYIYMPTNGFAGNQESSLPKMYSGASIQIKFFKKLSGPKFGEKFFTVFNMGGFNQVIEFEQAYESGEIIYPKNPLKNKSSINTSSISDELIKLKKLLDNGVLTQAEFDAQKKKILNN